MSSTGKRATPLRPGTEKHAPPSPIDTYLAALPVEHRRALEKLRRTIGATAPRAEEVIRYWLPAFRLDGRPLVAFGATARAARGKQRAGR
jgi:uncharacterized protein YdhG (YjbR/CyaY superfamily)